MPPVELGKKVRREFARILISAAHNLPEHHLSCRRFLPRSKPKSGKTDLPSSSSNSLVRRKDLADIARDGIKRPREVWLDEDCTELTIHSDRYDQVIPVLLFGSASRREFPEIEVEEDSFDRFGRRSRGRFGD